MVKDVISAQPAAVELSVLNELGVHARVAARIAATVQQFDCELTLSNGAVQAEGDSILSILTLDAPRGTKLTATASGPQAQQALDALTLLFASGFGD